LSGQHEIVVEDRLFATLDTLTREVELGEGYRARVTETVGFIRKLPHHLVASFRATLEEARSADVLLHVVDASHPGWEEQMEVVEQVLVELGLQDRPVLPVFNKIDRLEDAMEFGRRVSAMYAGAVLTTSMRTDGLNSLRNALREREQELRPPVWLRLPLVAGAQLAALYRLGEVMERRDSETGFALRVRLPPAEVDRLRHDGVEILGASVADIPPVG
jgi:GTP-binding protein HflX